MWPSYYVLKPLTRSKNSSRLSMWFQRLPGIQNESANTQFSPCPQNCYLWRGLGRSVVHGRAVPHPQTPLSLVSDSGCSSEAWSPTLAKVDHLKFFLLSQRLFTMTSRNVEWGNRIPDTEITIERAMLHRISYEALKKTAIYGAALSTTGSFILYYQIQSRA